MKLLEALEVLDAWDRSGRYVFSTGDLARIFGEPRNQPALSGTLTRLVSENVLSLDAHGGAAGRVADCCASAFPWVTMPRTLYSKL